MIRTEYKTEKDMKKRKKKSQRKFMNVRRRRRLLQKMLIGFAVLIILLLILLLIRIFKPSWLSGKYEELEGEKIEAVEPEIDVELLTVNPYSRPGEPTSKITGIVVHYTANPGTTAQQNRDYFESLSQTGETSASSHFVIGIDGELIQCIPCQEIAYASNERNGDTIAIECCIPDETGKFADATYDTLIHLLAWLAGRYHLGTEDIIRHYDVTGKECPKYYVENEDAWKEFKKDVKSAMKK